VELRHGGQRRLLPAVANGVVYIGSYDHNLYAFDLAGGLATPSRPSQSSLHPNYKLQGQR
jgi:outer membrane protein assembly factor BamB